VTEIGWWAADGIQRAAGSVAACPQQTAESLWESWNGARNKCAQAEWPTVDGNRLIPPSPEDYDVLELSSRSYTNLLVRQHLPAQFGLMFTNNKWSDYLALFPLIRIEPDVVIDGRQCYSLMFDMAAKNKDDQVTFPWFVCFDKDSLLAVRTESYLEATVAARINGHISPTADEVRRFDNRDWILSERLSTTSQTQVHSGLWIPVTGLLAYGPIHPGFARRVSVTVLEGRINEPLDPQLFNASSRAGSRIVDAQMLATGVFPKDEQMDTAAAQRITAIIGAMPDGWCPTSARVTPDSLSQSFFELTSLYIAGLGSDRVRSVSDIMVHVSQSDMEARSLDPSTLCRLAHEIGLSAVQLRDRTLQDLDSFPGWIIAYLEQTGSLGAKHTMCRWDKHTLIAVDESLVLHRLQPAEVPPGKVQCVLVSSEPISWWFRVGTAPTWELPAMLVGVLGVAASGFMVLRHRRRENSVQGASTPSECVAGRR
jgi:hypothetical protein